MPSKSIDRGPLALCCSIASCASVRCQLEGASAATSIDIW
jgi:hypothetical protein